MGGSVWVDGPTLCAVEVPLSAKLLPLLAMLLVVFAAGPMAPDVGAHAVLVESQPAADSLVQDPPEEVLLTFSEGISIASDGVTLLDPAGEPVDDVRSVASADVVRASVPELDRDGSYTVTWSVVSADGHPLRGSFLFHLRDRSLDEPTVTVTSGAPPLASAVRVVGAASAIAGLVWVFACALTGRRHRWRWAPVVVGTLLLSVGAVMAVVDDPGESLRIVLATESGRMGVLALVVAVVGLAVSWWAHGDQAEVAVAAAATVTVAAQGHAASLAPVWFSAGLTVVHVATAVGWGVALVVLERRARVEGAQAQEVRDAALRFSPWGVVAVLALAATGVALVVDRVGLGGLTTTTYGRLGTAKAVLLIAAAAIALYNRFRVLPAADLGRLRRSLKVEIVVLAVALSAGAVLAQVPPESAVAAAGPSVPAGGPFTQSAPFGDGEVELTVQPGTRGTNEVHITALGDDGRLMGAAEAFVLQISLPARDVGPLVPELTRITNGHSTGYVNVPYAGEWTFEVSSRVSQFSELRATFTVPIGERAGN